EGSLGTARAKGHSIDNEQSPSQDRETRLLERENFGFCSCGPWRLIFRGETGEACEIAPSGLCVAVGGPTAGPQMKVHKVMPATQRNSMTIHPFTQPKSKARSDP